MGGITGYAAKSLQNATSYCTISILNWRAESGTATSNNYFGAIQGINTPTNHITNCNIGGKIITASETVNSGEDASGESETIIVETPGVLNVSNYATYIIGGEAMTAAAAKAQNCGVITSVDDTTPEYAN